MKNRQNKLLRALNWIIEILNNNKVDYLISGGFAASLYGSNRIINDIDIDIAENDFVKIYDDVKAFIIFGPDTYIDRKWDLKLMTLNYYGQEIDIAGAFNQKLFDEKLQKWILSPTSFCNSKQILFHDTKLNVIEPESLIAYKQLLDGEHQKTDIKAVWRFINKKGKL
jgi:hypothetical protein